MLENRYGSALAENDAQYLSLGPPVGWFWHIAADLINQAGYGSCEMLEIGCGIGNSAKPILQRTDVDMLLLDVNASSFAKATKNLQEFVDRIEFLHIDALQYLENCKGEFEVIYSSFVVHNFKRKDRPALLGACRQALKPNGLFILDDCIPPDDEEIDHQLLVRQINRYKHLSVELQPGIISHVIQDASPEYRMPEGQIMQDLADAGFASISVVDRVEREALITARA